MRVFGPQVSSLFYIVEIQCQPGPEKHSHLAAEGTQGTEEPDL